MTGGSLFRKYVVVLVLFVSGVLVASGLVQVLFDYQETQAMLSALQQEKANSAATRISAFLDGTEQLLDGAIAAPFASTTDQRAERRDDLLRLLRQSPAIMEVSYVDADGREQVQIARLDLNLLGSQRDRSDDPAFVNATRTGTTYFGPVYFRADSEPYMLMSVADHRARAGALIAEVNLKFIWDVVSSIRIGEAGLAYVVDGSGHLVAHPDISLVLGRATFSDLPQVQVVRENPGTTDQRALVAHDLHGNRVLSAFAPVTAVGWSVFVEQPLDEAFAPLYASLARTLGLVVFGLVLAVGLSFWLARRMVRPIQALRSAAARIGSGRLDERIRLRTGDELEALAGELNQMAAQLGESYATLESRVTARTQDLAAANDQLEQASRHKSQFLASMSHELRTPLNAIIGFSDALTEKYFGDLTPKQERYVSHIQTSGRHLLSLINDILDLAKVEAGHMELDAGRFSLAEAMETGLAMVRERAHRHGLVLELHMDPDLDAIEADERKVKQILFNLLTNAVKFTPDGGRVDVFARCAGDCAEVSIQDTGIGIGREDQSRIFGAFHQIRNGVLRAQEGTGLGLTLTRRFVELHGGQITVESEPGVGSTFTFTLPLVQPCTAPAGHTQREVRANVR